MKNIAIADVLRHPKYGLVSYQPDLRDRKSRTSSYVPAVKVNHQTKLKIIRVASKSHKIFWVILDDCERANKEERDYYWKIFNHKKTKYEYINSNEI